MAILPCCPWHSNPGPACAVPDAPARHPPKRCRNDPSYNNVVAEVCDYLRRRRDAMLAAGMLQQRIALDPGIGFGKTTQHNLALLSNIAEFHTLGCPVLVGPSRKAFIGQVLGNPQADRTAGTIGVAASLALQGVQILRVHDVAPVRQALLLLEATGALGPTSPLTPRDLLPPPPPDQSQVRSASEGGNIFTYASHPGRRDSS